MRILRILFVLLLVGILGAAGVAGLAIWYFDRDLPDYQQLADYEPPIVSRVLAGDGRLLAEYATEKRVFVPVSAVPPRVIHAFLAAEDKNFYSHIGIDPLAMLRAAATDVMRVSTHRRPVGASTITQQVAKNFLVGNERSWQRKIKEALVALRMEKALSKDRILELYLNEIYLGAGAYGVAAAALTYFNKSLDELSPEEAAMLAALPKAPNEYNPQRRPKQALERRNWVLDRMVEAGFLTAEEEHAAKERPIQLRHRDEMATATAPYFTEEIRRELLAHYGDKALYESGFTVRSSLDPTLQPVADTALRAALVAYDRRHGYRGPVAKIDAAGDWRGRLAKIAAPAGAEDAAWRLAMVTAVTGEAAQIGFADNSRGVIPFDELKWARPVLDDDRLGPVPKTAADVLDVGEVLLVERAVAPPPKEAKPGRRGARVEKIEAERPTEPRFTLRQIPEISGGIVALDPHTGRVLAMTGGFSYAISQFDRVTQAVRQTGSAIKPFIYLSALDHGFTPSTLVLDAPVVIDPGPGQPKWKPANFEHNFLGPQPMRIGLEESRNLMTIRLGTAVGLDVVGQYVERFGIMDHMPLEYSMLIGATETTLLRLTTAYAMIVNGGKRITPSFIDRVQDRNGRTIFRADNRSCAGCSDVDWHDQAPPDLPDPREQIADPASVYQLVSLMEGVVQRGTGRIVASVGKPLAGKTGTTNDFDDAWFVGFSPDLAVGVFAGYDTPRSLGGHETGAAVAAPAFRDFMAVALKDKPAIPFRIPPGIRLVRVNAATGQLAQAGDKVDIYEAFKPGTEPTGDATVVVGGAGVSEDGDALAVTPGGMPMAPGAAPAGATVPVRQPVPSSGTGGLY